MHPKAARAGDVITPRLSDRVLGLSNRTARKVSDRLDREAERRRVNALSDADWLTWAYLAAFDREPDPLGQEHWTGELSRGMRRSTVLGALKNSAEAKNGPIPRQAMETFHGGRCAWTRAMPRARRIIDLGGTALGSELGSLMVMGYPYPFESLTIVELPSDDRHALYQVGDNSPEIPSPLGPIRYLYQSMVELDNIPDGSVDLVVSGQTFEHITPEDGKRLLAHTRRILSPEGHLALDTPNRAVTEIQCAVTGEEFINPDHKIEYTHEQMMDLFAEAGLEVVRAQGIGYMPETAATKEWLLEEQVRYAGLFDDIESSYTLAYLARRA
ncbi:MAG: Methyltransferase type 11 [Pseudonocardiales bacterium]|nr:Methyltransferase type 11 [Pseudonocardiales bacterium]